uniref:Cytochrome b5 heme-binding domain-containing protein n=1 Tax=Cuerna arida TaxID=1464854 RepID=A0A1B6EJG7_9HEMI
MADLKTYTLEEVKEHTTSKSTWFVIDNFVYDVTEFLNEHPGGEEVLLEASGDDASEQFEDVGHSNDARELMVKYRIGVLDVEDQKKLKASKPQSESDTIGSASDRNSNPDSFGSNIIIPILVLAAVSFGLHFVYRWLQQTETSI